MLRARRAQGLVLEWLVLHRDELLQDWRDALAARVAQTPR